MLGTTIRALLALRQRRQRRLPGLRHAPKGKLAVVVQLRGPGHRKMDDRKRERALRSTTGPSLLPGRRRAAESILHRYAGVRLALAPGAGRPRRLLEQRRR